MVEGLTYTEVDGVMYPDIAMPDETEELKKLGKYGRMDIFYNRYIKKCKCTKNSNGY